MTAVVVSAILDSTARPLPHRLALRLGRALIAWGARPLAREPRHLDRVDRMERARDAAARTLPQLPR
ncbi:hypothetical protein AB4Z18_09310 [Leifsonia sp. 2TAF2]|uniref:hypothetical protein n=1 Tax=Leifsonia sp. 2TAF2 TaxID=3233009 RepID=UPI003F9AEAEA